MSNLQILAPLGCKTVIGFFASHEIDNSDNYGDLESSINTIGNNERNTLNPCSTNRFGKSSFPSFTLF